MLFFRDLHSSSFIQCLNCEYMVLKKLKFVNLFQNSFSNYKKFIEIIEENNLNSNTILIENILIYNLKYINETFFNFFDISLKNSKKNVLIDKMNFLLVDFSDGIIFFPFHFFNFYYVALVSVLYKPIENDNKFVFRNSIIKKTVVERILIK